MVVLADVFEVEEEEDDDDDLLEAVEEDDLLEAAEEDEEEQDSSFFASACSVVAFSFLFSLLIRLSLLRICSASKIQKT